eukprot:COSAG05_NODE_8725_length_677_cov_0.802768_2_plen_76_part_01
MPHPTPPVTRIVQPLPHTRCWLLVVCSQTALREGLERSGDMQRLTELVVREAESQLSRAAEHMDPSVKKGALLKQL